MQTIVAVVLCVGLAVNAVGAEENGRLVDQLLDGTTKQPLPNAVVAVVGTGWGAATDGEGRFQIDALPGRRLQNLRPLYRLSQPV